MTTREILGYVHLLNKQVNIQLFLCNPYVAHGSSVFFREKLQRMNIRSTRGVAADI